MGVAGRYPVLARTPGSGGPERNGSGREPRGWPDGRVHVRHHRVHVHAHGGGWILPLILLTVFAAASAQVILGFLFLALVMAAVAFGAVIAGTMLARVVQALFAPATLPPLPARGRRREPAVPAPALTPYRLSGGTLAAPDGLDLYRRRLLDVLKERYVRGQISLAEFEACATLIARDPSARHLG
jgi:hypothetical protein